MSGLEEIEKYMPPKDLAGLVLSWLRRCRESQFAHYEMGNAYAGYHKTLGIPTIGVAAIISCSVFIAMQKTGGEDAKVVAAALSVLSVVLTSLQTFLKFSETSAAHKAAGAEYAALRRRLEVIHASDQPKDPKQISKIEEEISALALKAPNISKKQFDKIIEKVGV
jgi:hypothetical protein